MEERFDWVDFYREFADKLLDFKDERSKLIEIIKKVFFDANIKLPTLENDNEIFDIDPFTVYGLFNKGISEKNRMKIISGFSRELKMESDIPRMFDGIPVLNNMNSTYYTFIDSREEDDIENLWVLFERALDYSKDESETNREKFKESFDKVMKQSSIGNAKLTMALFWINPRKYLNLDSTNCSYIYTSGMIPNDLVLSLPKVDSYISADKYLDIVEKIDKYLKSNKDGPSSFIDLSNSAYIYSMEENEEELHNRASKDDSGWIPKEYDPGISKDEWLELLDNRQVFTDDALTVVRRLKNLGGEATCSQLSQAYGLTYNYYSSNSVQLAKRIAKEKNIQAYIDDKGKNNWWPILYLGKDTKNEDIGVFKWKLRPELSEALDEYNKENINYWWLNANPDIWSFSNIDLGQIVDYTSRNETGNKRRIYQNFLDARKGDLVLCYETSPRKKLVAICEISENYDGEKIYFKKIRDLEKYIDLDELKKYSELEKMEFFRSPQGSFFKLKEAEYIFIINLLGKEGKKLEEVRLELIVNAFQQLGGRARAGEIKNIVEEKPGFKAENFSSEKSLKATISYIIQSHSSDTESYKVGNQDLFYSIDGVGKGYWGLRNYYKVREKVDFSLPINLDSLFFEDKESLKKQIEIALKSGKSIILVGPPGTGKSKIASCITRSYGVESKMVTAMSDWSSYDTIGGYKPNNEGSLELEDGIFLSSIKDREGNNINKWLIIDEINRADIDKAFGPFFSALSGDDTELGLKDGAGNNIELLLEKNLNKDFIPESFQYILPEDWRIIATMNTFDKTSLYEMSYAFMRRFAFIPVGAPKNINNELVKELSLLWDLDLDKETCLAISKIWEVINKYRKVGPALIEDIARFVELGGDYSSAINLYILPQLEGLFDDNLKNFYKDLGDLEFIEDKERLKNSIEDFFNISLGNN